MFPNQVSLISTLHERNKFALKQGYFDPRTEKGMVNVIIDSPDQLVQVYNDKKSPKLKEQQ